MDSMYIGNSLLIDIHIAMHTNLIFQLSFQYHSNKEILKLANILTVKLEPIVFFLTLHYASVHSNM